MRRRSHWQRSGVDGSATARRRRWRPPAKLRPLPSCAAGCPLLDSPGVWRRRLLPPRAPASSHRRLLPLRPSAACAAGSARSVPLRGPAPGHGLSARACTDSSTTPSTWSSSRQQWCARPPAPSPPHACPTPAPPRPPACPARRRAARPLTLPRADGGGRPSTTPRRRFCPARFCRPPSRARSTGCSGWHGAELTLPAPGASRLADAALAMARLLCRAGRAGAQLSMGYDAMRCLRPIVRARAERARTLRRARRARRRWASRGGSAARPPCLGLGRAGDPCARLPPRPSSAACGFGLDLMLL